MVPHNLIWKKIHEKKYSKEYSKENSRKNIQKNHLEHLSENLFWEKICETISKENEGDSLQGGFDAKEPIDFSLIFLHILLIERK